MLCGYIGIAISILILKIEVNTGSLYFKNYEKKHEQQNRKLKLSSVLIV